MSTLYASTEILKHIENMRVTTSKTPICDEAMALVATLAEHDLLDTAELVSALSEETRKALEAEHRRAELTQTLIARDEEIARLTRTEAEQHEKELALRAENELLRALVERGKTPEQHVKLLQELVLRLIDGRKP